MFKKMLATLAGVAIILTSSGAALATPTTLVAVGSQWSYQQFSQPDLWTNWSAAGYSSFNWSNATWSTGNAAFGNPYSLPYATNWTAGTDLALQKNFTIDGALTGLLKLNVASDNGFMVFINGTQVAKDNKEGYTNYWEYTYNLSNSLFVSPGNNLIQVLAEDHGGATFFDMQLTADVAPVPEPSTILLFGAGIGCFAFWRRRKN